MAVLIQLRSNSTADHDAKSANSHTKILFFQQRRNDKCCEYAWQIPFKHIHSLYIYKKKPSAETTTDGYI